MDRFRRSFNQKKKREFVVESGKPEQWKTDEKKVREMSCSFQVKYLGCVEVLESRGIQVCEQALKQLRNNKNKNCRAVLYVTGDALRVVDELSKGLIVDQTIEKVSFCAPDRHSERGFAYICREGTTRRWMCHGFTAIKESGERLSHAVGCAFTVCLEKKQQREREKMAAASTRSASVGCESRTRASGFRQASLLERIADPQSAIIAEPVPPPSSFSRRESAGPSSPSCSERDKSIEVARPHAPVDLLFQRQGSFRGFDKLGEIAPFKRQLSLRLDELSATLDRQRRFTEDHKSADALDGASAAHVSNGAAGHIKPRIGNIQLPTVSPVVEASPCTEQSSDFVISHMCQQITRGLSALNKEPQSGSRSDQTRSEGSEIRSEGQKSAWGNSNQSPKINNWDTFLSNGDSTLDQGGQLNNNYKQHTNGKLNNEANGIYNTESILNDQNIAKQQLYSQDQRQQLQQQLLGYENTAAGQQQITDLQEQQKQLQFLIDRYLQQLNIQQQLKYNLQIQEQQQLLTNQNTQQPQATQQQQQQQQQQHKIVETTNNLSIARDIADKLYEKYVQQHNDLQVLQKQLEQLHQFNLLEESKFNNVINTNNSIGNISNHSSELNTGIYSTIEKQLSNQNIPYIMHSSAPSNSKTYYNRQMLGPQGMGNRSLSSTSSLQYPINSSPLHHANCNGENSMNSLISDSHQNFQIKKSDLPYSNGAVNQERSSVLIGGKRPSEAELWLTSTAHALRPHSARGSTVSLDTYGQSFTPKKSGLLSTKQNEIGNSIRSLQAVTMNNFSSPLHHKTHNHMINGDCPVQPFLSHTDTVHHSDILAFNGSVFEPTNCGQFNSVDAAYSGHTLSSQTIGATGNLGAHGESNYNGTQNQLSYSANGTANLQTQGTLAGSRVLSNELLQKVGVTGEANVTEMTSGASALSADTRIMIDNQKLCADLENSVHLNDSFSLGANSKDLSQSSSPSKRSQNTLDTCNFPQMNGITEKGSNNSISPGRYSNYSNNSNPWSSSSIETITSNDISPGSGINSIKNSTTKTMEKQENTREPTYSSKRNCENIADYTTTNGSLEVNKLSKDAFDSKWEAISTKQTVSILQNPFSNA